MDLSELTKQAPGIVGVIVIVAAFLNAQSKRDAAFLDMLKTRDAAFSKILGELTQRVGGIGELLVSHDSWEKGVFTKKPYRKAASSRRRTA